MFLLIVLRLGHGPQGHDQVRRASGARRERRRD